MDISNKYIQIFEDKNIIVIEKLAAMSFHSETEVGLFSCVNKDYENKTGEKLISVHRLDKETTGLIIFAKTKDIAKRLSLLFENKMITKYYLALSNQKPKKKQGLIKGDLLKSRGGSYKLSKSLSNPSLTQFFSFFVDDGIRGFVLKPHTGKTHQLRVVMKSIGSPIIGDKRYGDGKEGDSMALTAFYLKFTLNNEVYEFTSQLNNYFKEEFNKLVSKSDLKNLNWPKI